MDMSELLNVILDTRQYYFWLVAVSVLCWALERLAPWRRGQRFLRTGLLQDLFFLVFNGHYVGILLASLAAPLIVKINDLSGLLHVPAPEEINLLSGWPLALQFVVVLVVRDFIEWSVHRLLHRVPWLWTFHKLHHSIVTLDWIGNFRFHWIEPVVYGAVRWLPLVILGIDERVLLPVAVVTTLIGHLNHSNLRIDWGPLRYVLNSARMHVWHHDVVCHKPYGQNFAIVFSLWDWLFGTAHLPAGFAQPERLGFAGMARYPRSLIGRLMYPLWPRPKKP